MLSRGTVFLDEPAPGSRSFVAGIYFPLGSRHEAPHERGFVHFIEHMLFKGTDRFGSKDIARTFDRIGGFVNAFTEKDFVCLHCIVPAREWELALELLIEMAFRSAFPELEFGRERGVVVSEILQTEDEPEERSHDAFLKKIWDGDPASLPIAGDADAIADLDLDSVRTFYERGFVPSRAIVSTSGPVPGSLIERHLVRLLDAVDDERRGAGRDTVPVRTAGTPVFTPCRCFVAAKTSQVYWYHGIQIDPPYTSMMYYTISALNSIVGEATSSRLFQCLREEKGLCYSVYSGFAMTRTECLWMAQAVVPPARFGAMHSEFSRLVRSLGEAEIEDDECADAVSRLAGAFDLALDDPDYRMRRCAMQWLMDGEVLSIDETRRRFESIHRDDIRALAHRLFGGTPQATMAYGRRTKSSRREKDFIDA